MMCFIFDKIGFKRRKHYLSNSRLNGADAEIKQIYFKSKITSLQAYF